MFMFFHYVIKKLFTQPYLLFLYFLLAMLFHSHLIQFIHKSTARLPNKWKAKKGKSLVKFNVAKQILTHLFLLFYSLKLKSDCLFIFKINKEGKLPRLKEKEVYPRTRRALFFILCKDFFFCGIKMTDKSRLYCHVVNIYCGGKFLQEMWREIFLLGVIERRA